MKKIVSIFERLGLGGGGKIKAVYKRMNAFAEMRGVEPILLTIDHGPKVKLNFAKLISSGEIAPGVSLLSVPEACLRAAVEQGVQAYADWPEYDESVVSGRRITYFQGGNPVMTDHDRATLVGRVTMRTVFIPDRQHEATLIDGIVAQIVQRNADQTIEITDFAAGYPIRWTKSLGRDFVAGKNLISGTSYRMIRAFNRSFFEMIHWDDSVVFFDGVTVAYLSPAVKAPRALFLHADHRGPDGNIVPRSKFLIENFEGEAIITSTEVHRKEIEADLTPSANLHVIPHVCEVGDPHETQRNNIVTVSRLDLTGKPIQECIKAFCLIKDEFPDVDYLIYGEGSGQAKLEALIARMGCGDRVKLMGYTTEPLSVFQGAILSVYPTMTEGFGLSILEALSNGCPVISYDVNYGPRELIRPGENGALVPPGDLKAIARSMREILRNPKKHQRGARAGLGRYTQQKYRSNYLDLVRGLIN